METRPPVFALTQVSKRFGDFVALSGITLTIQAGERVALVGASGAGKSTLLGLLNGTLWPSSGVVRVFGQDIARLATRQLRAVQRQVGTIYQQFHLVDNLQVIHNVNAGHLGRWSLAKALRSLVRPLGMEQARGALAEVGIPEKLYARTDQLSGGQQQRVALARVLVQDPQAILADEPIASLDPKRGLEIMNLLCRLAATRHKTLVSSLHSVEYVFTHFERAIGLRAGRIVFDAPVSALSRAALQALYDDE